MSGTTRARRMAILGLGRYMPAQVRDNGFWDGVGFIADRAARLEQDFLEQTKTERSDDLAALQQQIMDRYAQDPFRGSRERRVADESQCAADLEEQAARAALEQAGIGPADIDMVLINSCPSDDYLPDNGTEVMRRLGCRPVSVMGIDSVCTSFQSMLMLADALILGGRVRYILAITSAMMTRLTERDDPMSITLGDGAAAAVLGLARGQGRLLGHVQRGLPAYRDVACCAPRGGHRWYEGHGRLVGMTRNVGLSRDVVMETAGMAREACCSVLSQAELSERDITHYFTHQGAIFFNEMVAEVCGLQHAQTANTFPRFGSVGAANVPINMAELDQQGAIPSGSIVYMFSTGMGLNWAATVLVWD